MPDRSAGRCREALAVLVLCALGPQGTRADCPARLEVSLGADGGVAMAFEQPCRPYAPVEVAYGALRFGEETGRQGGLRLSLPALRGVSALSVTPARGARLEARLPAPERPPQDYVAVVWPDGTARGTLVAPGGDALALGLGFPGRRPSVTLLVSEASGTAARLRLPVDAQSCGQRLSAQVVTSAQSEPAALSVSMPACPGGGFVDIPLDEASAPDG